MRSAVLLAFVGSALFVYAPDPRDQARGAEPVPDGLSATDWSSIRAVYDANRHAASAVEGGYVARNPGQQWRTGFDGRGFVTTPDSRGWLWGMELVRFGFEGSQRTVETPICADAFGQRVVYEWDDCLTEWYVNDRRGLEHGYMVHQRPVGGVGALRFTLAVRGGLDPRLSADGRAVTFIDANGAPVVNYSGLKVFDATGKALPARFEEASSQAPTISAQSELPLFAIRHSQFITIVVNDCDAVYPLTIDPIAQQAYLKASNTGANDQFGYSVAVSGNTVVVGAPFEDSSATGVNGNQADNSAVNPGAAYVFVRSGGVWSQQAYLKASNTAAGDFFGFSVAASGDTVVVGAYGDDSNATGVDGNQADNSAADSGAAYVFVRNGTTWSQQAYLKASNTGANDQFGRSVAVSGDTVVVGAPFEDSNATGVDDNGADNSAADSGAAYVFVRSGTVWSQSAYFKASNTGAFDNFGYSVAASGDTVVAGAYGEDSNATGVNGNQADDSVTDSGAAYIFVRDPFEAWSQQAYLKVSNNEVNVGLPDHFGYSVAVSGDTVVVGAPFEDSNATGVNGDQADYSAEDSGAVYVFVRSGGVWSLQAYLKASNTEAVDFFGYSVAVSGDTVGVGAIYEDSSATGVDGNQADNSATDSGAAYVFVRSGAVWSQGAYLKASNTGAGVGLPDNFGYSVAVSGTTVVVGANQEDSSATGVNGNQVDNSASGSGAAYVFLVRSDTTTTLTSSSNPTVFGEPVTFTATVTVSAPGTGMPTGTVTFKDGATTIGTVTLNAVDVATFSTSALAVGSHSITAAYGGDTGFNSSTSLPLSQNVNHAGTTTTLVPSLNPSAFGQPVTFTATVTVNAPGTGTPTGTVTFRDGATTIGAGTLNASGVASFATSALAVGSHQMRASYGGDTGFNASTSLPLSQNVNRADTTTTLASPSNPSAFGQPVTFTATVTVSAPGTGMPTGTVTFKDGATTIGTGTLNASGVATLSTSALAMGSHQIRANYGGDTGFNASTSQTLSQNVNTEDTTTTLASSSNPSAFGQPVTFTATVTVNAPGTGTPTGTVTFNDGATTIGTGTLNASGVATFATSALAVEGHQMRAAYGGDTGFNSSTSLPLSQNVIHADTTTTLASSSNPSVFGQPVTFTATVTVNAPGTGTPTGAVTLNDGATTIGTGTLNASGVATFSTSALAAGNHQIRATYGGDTSFVGGDSQVLTQTILADTDGDGVRDSLDGCPNDANKIAAGICGCGRTDADANANGLADCIDPTIGPCPDNLTLTATSADGIAVDFMLPAGGSPLGETTVTSDPPPGSILPLGTTTVTITARDVHGVTASCTFDVTVRPPDAAPQAAPQELESCAVLSPIVRSPICGMGCPLALMSTLGALYGMQRSRRRRRLE